MGNFLISLHVKVIQGGVVLSEFDTNDEAIGNELGKWVLASGKFVFFEVTVI